MNPIRNVTRKLSTSIFTFVQGSFTFQTLAKTPRIYSVSYFNLRGLGAFKGANPTQATRSDGTV